MRHYLENQVILGFLKQDYHAQNPKNRMHSFLGPAKGSSIWCANLVESLGNSIVPLMGKTRKLYFMATI